MADDFTTRLEGELDAYLKALELEMQEVTKQRFFEGLQRLEALARTSFKEAQARYATTLAELNTTLRSETARASARARAEHLLQFCLDTHKGILQDYKRRSWEILNS